MSDAASALIPFAEATDAQKVRHVLMAAMVLTGTVYTHDEWDEAMAAVNRLAANQRTGRIIHGDA